MGNYLKYLLPLIVILIACGGRMDASAEICNINDNECKINLIQFILIADNSLNDDTKLAIVDALAEWDIKVGSHIDYKIMYSDMLKENDNINTFNHSYKLYIKDPGEGILGWTDWEPQGNSARILIKPSLDAETFRIVLLHELGHAFDLRFGSDIHYTGEYKSIMHPSIGNTGQLQCPELNEFCNRYGCIIDCENYVKINGFFLQSFVPEVGLCGVSK